MGSQLLAILLCLQVHLACVCAQVSLGAKLLARTSCFTYIIYIAQAQHLLRNIDALAQIGCYLLDAVG